jgi:hypothetical protein
MALRGQDDGNGERVRGMNYAGIILAPAGRRYITAGTMPDVARKGALPDRR